MNALRGTVTLVSGDNLGSNYIGGFKQMSSALRKCRFCMAVASDMCEKVSGEYVTHNILYMVHDVYKSMLRCICCLHAYV